MAKPELSCFSHLEWLLARVRHRLDGVHDLNEERNKM